MTQSSRNQPFGKMSVFKVERLSCIQNLSTFGEQMEKRHRYFFLGYLLYLVLSFTLK